MPLGVCDIVYRKQTKTEKSERRKKRRRGGKGGGS
jgi:hypothetical protein